MDQQAAQTLLRAELQAYAERSHAELVSLVGTEARREQPGPGGTVYQIEAAIFWDSQPGGAIRVLASIDDGGWRAFAPLTASILKEPQSFRSAACGAWAPDRL